MFYSSARSLTHDTGLMPHKHLALSGQLQAFCNFISCSCGLWGVQWKQGKHEGLITAFGAEAVDSCRQGL